MRPIGGTTLTTWRQVPLSGRRLRARDDAELLQEPERVPHFPRLGDLAAIHAMDRDRIDANLLARRRDPVHFTDVRARARPANHDAVAGREDFLDAPVA